MKSETRYYCGTCGGHVTDLTAVHRIDDEGNVQHNCPTCDKPGYHFQASHAVVKEVVGGGHEWLANLDNAGSHTPSSHCPACWQMTGREMPDFTSFTVPAGWQLDDNYCHPAAGFAIERTGKKYRALLHSKSISRLSPDEPIWWATVVSGSWHNHARPYEGQSHDYEALLAEVDAHLDQLEAAFADEIATHLAECQQIANEKGYKPGWVWYQVKDKFGSDIANEVLPK